MTGKTEKYKIILNEEFYGKFDLQCFEYEIFVAKSQPTGTSNLSFESKLVNNAILFLYNVEDSSPYSLLVN